ncbi:hypothetical protein ATCCBAA256_00070, partial [Mycobacterium montefiorense]
SCTTAGCTGHNRRPLVAPGRHNVKTKLGFGSCMQAVHPKESTNEEHGTDGGPDRCRCGRPPWYRRRTERACRPGG